MMKIKYIININKFTVFYTEIGTFGKQMLR